MIDQHPKGFTLMEILIVIIILGVLAGIAVPIYSTQVEKSRTAEAITMLSATRQSMLRYFEANSTYVGASFPPPAGPVTIDFNPNALLGGQTKHFAYAVVVPGALSFKIYATRIATPDAPLPPGGPYVISIKQDGSIG